MDLATIGSCENRNEQFEHIAKLKNEFKTENQVILSLDTKKKEMLGNFAKMELFF